MDVIKTACRIEDGLGDLGIAREKAAYLLQEVCESYFDERGCTPEVKAYMEPRYSAFAWAASDYVFDMQKTIEELTALCKSLREQTTGKEGRAA